MAYSRTLNHFTSMQELATIWASSTSYVVNQLVIESDKLYRCLVAHTSGGTFIADLQAARWVEISASEAGVFNYIGNPDAEVDASGWTTYAESDSVTFTDAGDLVTLNNHGLSNGNEISFTSITSTTGISINTRYFVVSATTNTFQVASSSGGSALPLTTNGSGTMVRFVPKTGSGGSPNITWSRSIVSPLRGDADFNLVKDAANRQGQGVEYDFTIDNADLAKVLTVTFDYEVVSGTLATGDVTVYLIQDPSGTPLVIQPAGYQIQSATVGTKMRQIATFQTSSSVTSYRLCLHVASVSASAYSLAVDNVVVGPQVVQYGAPVTDWQSYTPTFTGFGTASAVTMYYRRVGDSLEIKGKFTSGTSTATEARISIPSGLTSDSSKISTIEVVGFMERGVIGSIGQDVGFSYAVLSEQSVGYVTFSSRSTGTTGLSKMNGNSVASSGQVLSLHAKVPILGWSSTVQMSNDTDTRVVAARGTFASTSIPTQVSEGSETRIEFSTVTYDTHGATTITSNSKFTAPVQGTYRFFGILSEINTTSANANIIKIYKNGSAFQNRANRWQNLTTNSSLVFNETLVLNAGDYIDVRYFQDSGGTRNFNSGTWAVERLSGPSAIAASETVAASYWLSANQSAGVSTPINFDSRVFDTHGAVTTGASWRFIAPIAGRYSVSTLTYAGNVNALIIVYKNGSIYAPISNQISNGTTAFDSTGTVVLSLLAGDYIDIRPNSTFTITGAATFSAANDAAKIYIHRIGN